MKKLKKNWRPLRINEIFIIVSLMICGCKKYDDDFFIQLHGPESRLINKQWDLEYLFIDGNDMTNIAKSNSCYSYTYFINGSQGKVIQQQVTFPTQSSTCLVGGTWSFTNNDNDLQMDYFGDSLSLGPYRSGQQVSWKIIKLSNDQLWLETLFDNQFCWIHFKHK